MDKRVILAVAGAGKTYHICHELDPQKKNLILAFTHENIYNIQRELCDAYGHTPEKTAVMTFDAFIYRYMVLPYEPSIGEYFGYPDFESTGICTIEPPKRTIPNGAGGIMLNHRYHKKDTLEHYITGRKQYYCATLSELIMQVNSLGGTLIHRLSHNLNLFYDCILIDEFQDFREHDYDLIIGMAKELENIVLVGDYYQHSVSATNNSGKPFKKGNKDVGYQEFISELKKHKFTVDTTTLLNSRRCAPAICNLAKDKLGIEIQSQGLTCGNVIWVDEKAEEYLENDDIIKLTHKEASKYDFKAVNWSYSKGNTYDSACVILTKKFENIDKETFTTKGIANATINMLYVALTRSRGDLYLIKYSTFKKIKSKYSKKVKEEIEE